MIQVSQHAVNSYIRRIYNERPSNACRTLRRSVERKIKRIVRDPDFVYHNKEDMPQIHVRGQAAAVVGVDKYGRPCGEAPGGELMPYESTEQDLIVPTVYKGSVYRSKANDDARKKKA